MLKRIKIRGKLLLLLATPLVAVMVFAYSGIVDRTERTAFQEGQARIAELADAGSDLSLAIQLERIRLLEADRLAIDAPDLLAEEREVTDQRLSRWLSAYEAARGDLVDGQFIEELDELAQRLPTTLSPDRGADAMTGTLLAGASRSVDEATIGLASEAADLDLFRALSNLNELLTIQSSYATITSVGSEAILQGSVSAVAATLVTEAELDAERSIAQFRTDADPDHLQAFERLQNSGVLPNPATGQVDSLADIRSYINGSSSGGALSWLRQGEERLIALNELVDMVVSDAEATAHLEAATASEEAQSFLILAGSVVLLALVMAVLIGRSISRPLIRLTRSAEQLSSEELPALVESLRSAGRAEAPILTPIEAKGRDEVAQLAHAISEIQQVTMDVAEEQSDLLRRGISDIFVNLARRNQSLLDRQIDFIDQLEAREENPDQLENLFRLDHLATRMRRNAESLLVLAGAEPTRRRGRPVEIVDVLRVAMGEIEDFSRIRLASVEPSTVAGSVAVDLAHLMSELMENATQFSPPDADVEVVGYRVADGSYQLTLADRGIGMSAEQIASANKTLAEPPLVGLDLSRSLGFTVVSRLAHRLGVSVQLTAGAEGGVTAVITIPAEMIGSATEDDSVPPVASATPPAPADTTPSPAVQATDAVPPVTDPLPEPDLATNPFAQTTPTVDDVSPPVVEQPAARDATVEPPAPDPVEGLAALPTRRPAGEPAPATPPVSSEPPPLPTRRPAAPAAPAAHADAGGDLFAAFSSPAAPAAAADPDQDLFAPIDGGSPAAPPAAPAPLPTRDPAAVGAVPPQVTSAGLIRRTPKQVDVPEESRYSPGAAPVAPSTADAVAPTANRSPEEVRQMLSRYRAGLRKGRAPGDGADQSNPRS